VEIRIAELDAVLLLSLDADEVLAVADQLFVLWGTPSKIRSSAQM
jgi:ABC-type uncharacterized transport system ATPase subunit